jgi:radical SAM protein with 4Fe4S-binding SPASM domain
VVHLGVPLPPTPRTLTAADRDRERPVYAVWEVTRRCNHACAHCGSRAGPTPEVSELTTAELLDIADQLVAMGAREVTLIGGEAYLRDDLAVLIERLASQGPRVTMQTGGRGLNLALCQRLKAAGLSAIGVSIDGPARVHDVLRASPGSHLAGMRALAAAREAGLVTTANSQVNRLTLPVLGETRDLLVAAGVRIWRPQLTVPMGRAADRPEWILQPWEILEVIDTLAALQLESAEAGKAAGLPPERFLDVLAGNNIGYFGPHETLLRSHPGARAVHWTGCQAGRYTMGIEADGTVKACPSLPTAPYDGGKVTDAPLAEIWEHADALRFTRDRTTDELWGFCGTCDYAEICRAGCSFTAHCTLGRRGNQPFCYHRAETLRGRGLRERLVHREAASGAAYDFGRFELVTEPWAD